MHPCSTVSFELSTFIVICISRLSVEEKKQALEPFETAAGAHLRMANMYQDFEDLFKVGLRIITIDALRDKATPADIKLK
jgi:hypothetical protein